MSSFSQPHPKPPEAGEKPPEAGETDTDAEHPAKRAKQDRSTQRATIALDPSLSPPDLFNRNRSRAEFSHALIDLMRTAGGDACRVAAGSTTSEGYFDTQQLISWDAGVWQ